jgi:hypothetical protein
MVVLWGCGAGGIVCALYFFGYPHRLADVVTAVVIYALCVICIFLVTFSASLCNHPRNFRILLQHVMLSCVRGVFRASDADAREFLQSRVDSLSAIDSCVSYLEEETFPVFDISNIRSSSLVTACVTSALHRYKCCVFQHHTSQL